MQKTKGITEETKMKIKYELASKITKTTKYMIYFVVFTLLYGLLVLCNIGCHRTISLF
jgi:hypothetical protein